jgi:N-acetylglucosamine-6-phosphate deacetylase
MEQKQWKIINGKVITPQRIIAPGTVLIGGTTITAIREGDMDTPEALTIDAAGNYVAPGFIDIHVHGGGGHDFMDNSGTAFLEIAAMHAKYGTTSMLPTLLTSAKEETIKILDLYEDACSKNSKGAQFIGIHLEGPYFAMNQRGAQDPRYIRNPDPAEYKEILSRFPVITRWSAAPELPGAIALGKYLRSKKVLASVAHTDAIYEEVLDAFENGYTHITHLYSAMSGVTRRNAMRYAGVIESAYLIDDMTVEIIADGIHLPAPLLKLVYKIKGPDKIALITDAMRAAGLGPGESILGGLHNGLRVIVEDGVAKLPDRSAFAGSVATANQLVKNMVMLAGVPISDAVKMMSHTPAGIMGIAGATGSLEVGKQADIVIFDTAFQVKKTIIKGEMVFSGEIDSASLTNEKKQP